MEIIEVLHQIKKVRILIKIRRFNTFIEIIVIIIQFLAANTVIVIINQ